MARDIVPDRLLARLEEAKRFIAFLDDDDREVDGYIARVSGIQPDGCEFALTDIMITRDQLVRLHLDAWDARQP